MTEDKPWHRVLLDEENTDRLGDLRQGQVGPMIALRDLLVMAGTKADGSHRLPAAKELYDGLERLPTAVDAKRAKLVAETIGRDQSEPDPRAQEWDPDASQTPKPGLKHRDEGSHDE